MEMSLIQRMRSAMAPAVVVLSLLVVLWIWGRWGYVRAAAWPAVRLGVLVGWVSVMFLAVTVAGVLWAAGGTLAGDRMGENRRQVFLGFAILVDGCGVLLVLVGLGSGMLTIGDVVRVYLLLAAWGGMWVQVVLALRQVGRCRGALAAVIGLTVAMALFAGPVTGVPLARASAGWGAGVQDGVVKLIGCGTPLMGMLDAVKGSVRVGWAQLPEMYQLSVLGQDIPMELPRWWVNFAAYLGVAAAAWALTRRLGKRNAAR